jgi:elongation factor Ts
MAIAAAAVKELRDKTGAGMLECKKALEESKGDVDAAVEYLRKQGLAAAQKRADRAADEGLVESYIHPGGKVGVLVEVNSETDFVARTGEFKALVKDLAMQVAAAAPVAVSREDLSKELVDKEREILAAQAAGLKKPPEVVDKIVTGKMEKFYKEVCLVEQAYIKDPKTTVQDRIKEVMSVLGENIVVRRFARFKLGAD